MQLIALLSHIGDTEHAGGNACHVHLARRQPRQLRDVCEAAQHLGGARTHEADHREIIRAVGENPTAARELGFRVLRIRLFAVAFGGAMAGMAGAYASTIYTPLWADGMIAGRGWIAVALVVFGTWAAGRIAFGALLFGALSLGGLIAQAAGVALPSQLLASLPYAVTILMLAVISSNRRRMRLNTVASLGQPFAG